MPPPDALLPRFFATLAHTAPEGDIPSRRRFFYILTTFEHPMFTRYGNKYLIGSRMAWVHFWVQAIVFMDLHADIRLALRMQSDMPK
jgi:hypothetical protein